MRKLFLLAVAALITVPAFAASFDTKTITATGNVNTVVTLTVAPITLTTAEPGASTSGNCAISWTDNGAAVSIVASLSGSALNFTPGTFGFDLLGDGVLSTTKSVSANGNSTFYVNGTAGANAGAMSQTYSLTIQ